MEGKQKAKIRQGDAGAARGRGAGGRPGLSVRWRRRARSPAGLPGAVARVGGGACTGARARLHRSRRLCWRPAGAQICVKGTVPFTPVLALW